MQICLFTVNHVRTTKIYSPLKEESAVRPCVKLTQGLTVGYMFIITLKLQNLGTCVAPTLCDLDCDKFIYPTIGL